jgi:hypothetical protein
VPVIGSSSLSCAKPIAGAPRRLPSRFQQGCIGHLAARRQTPIARSDGGYLPGDGDIARRRQNVRSRHWFWWPERVLPVGGGKDAIGIVDVWLCPAGADPYHVL